MINEDNKKVWIKSQNNRRYREPLEGQDYDASTRDRNQEMWECRRAIWNMKRNWQRSVKRTQKSCINIEELN